MAEERARGSGIAGICRAGTCPPEMRPIRLTWGVLQCPAPRQLAGPLQQLITGVQKEKWPSLTPDAARGTAHMTPPSPPAHLRPRSCRQRPREGQGKGTAQIRGGEEGVREGIIKKQLLARPEACTLANPLPSHRLLTGPASKPCQHVPTGTESHTSLRPPAAFQTRLYMTSPRNTWWRPRVTTGPDVRTL